MQLIVTRSSLCFSRQKRVRLPPVNLWHIKAWGTCYVHIAEVNGIIEKYTGVWPMPDSELCLEMSGCRLENVVYEIAR